MHSHLPEGTSLFSLRVPRYTKCIPLQSLASQEQVSFSIMLLYAGAFHCSTKINPHVELQKKSSAKTKLSRGNRESAECTAGATKYCTLTAHGSEGMQHKLPPPWRQSCICHQHISDLVWDSVAAGLHCKLLHAVWQQWASL